MNNLITALRSELDRIGANRATLDQDEARVKAALDALLGVTTTRPATAARGRPPSPRTREVLNAYDAGETVAARLAERFDLSPQGALYILRKYGRRIGPRGPHRSANGQAAAD